MRLLPSSLLVCLFWILQTAAIYESDVGVVDWHRSFIGVPSTTSPASSPSFHRVKATANSGNTKSFVVTATESNVLAALDPVNGTVVWRHVFDSQDGIATFQKQENLVVSLSGPGGSRIRVFDITNGQLIVEKQLHPPEEGVLTEPLNAGASLAFAGIPNTPDIVVLTNGHTVHNLPGTESGKVWTWKSQDQSSLVLYSEVVSTPDTVYVIGLAKSFSSFTIHITALSSATGEVLADADVPSSVSNGFTDILVVQTANDQPLVLWLEKSSIKFIPLTSTLKFKPKTYSKGTYSRLENVGLSKVGQFVAHKSAGGSSIIRMDDKSGDIKSIWDFDADVPGSTTNALYAGGFDKDKNAYIAKLYWSYPLQLASAEIFSSHIDKGGMITGYSFPFDTATHGIINHFAFDTAHTGGYTVVGRLLLTTSTGAVQLWHQDTYQWTREESLASISAAHFVELPEKQAVAANGSVARGEHETFVERVMRQIGDAQNFPQYVLNFAKRFATGSYASASSSATVPSNIESLHSRDTFGFRQIIIVVTAYRKVFAIDSSNGKTLWSRILGLGVVARYGGGSLVPLKAFLVKTVIDEGDPEAVVVCQRNSHSGLQDTVLFHFNVLTGENLLSLPQDVPQEGDGVLPSHDIVQEPVSEAFLLNHEEKKVVVLLDKFLQVYLYPDTDAHKELFHKLARSLHVPIIVDSPHAPGHRRVAGHQFIQSPQLGEQHVAYPTWTLTVPPEEGVQSIVPASRGPVASHGKVLGNRTTLYKYINPRLSVILTTSHTVSPPHCGVYVIDNAKGSIIYHARVPASSSIMSPAGGCNVQASLVENWLVYHYYDPEFQAEGQAKGFRVVTVEIYEGKGIDDKTDSSGLSAFSNKTLDVNFFAQSYVLQDQIVALAVTTTKFGISSKDLIYASDDGKIRSLSQRFLNPRRPSRKVTTEEQEEFLFPYDPILPNDPKLVLSHTYKVSNVRKIITAPALLESTSLVFAYGLDLFFTRVAPSKTFDVLSESFNKTQLVFTVGGLLIAIFMTRPMVRRKQLREKWYH